MPGQAFGIALDHAHPRQHGKGQKNRPHHSAQHHVLSQQVAVDINCERRSSAQQHANPHQQFSRQPELVLQGPVERLDQQRRDRIGGEHIAGLGTIEADDLMQPDGKQRVAGRPGKEEEKQ